MTDETDLELRKELTRLRALLYTSRDVALATDDRDGRRYLCDRYVMLDVTHSVAIAEVADGIYKLVASKGFEPREGEDWLNGGVVDFFDHAEAGAIWTAVTPTQWSVAEHPGKAMLLVAGTVPCLIGESTWTALHRHYREPLVEYNVAGGNMFRAKSRVAGVIYGILGYVAGIRIPDGQVEIARQIADLTVPGSGE